MKKAQSAMEYLMTYGWAILVILIAIGALFYLGVFDPSVPNTCSMEPPFTCMGIKGLDGLHNGYTGEDGTYVSSIIVFKVGVGSARSPEITSASVDGTPCDYITPTLNENQQTSVYCRINSANGLELNEDDKFTGNFELSYTESYSGFSHSVGGSFSGTIEACNSDDDCPSKGELDCLDGWIPAEGSICSVDGECIMDCVIGD